MIQYKRMEENGEKRVEETGEGEHTQLMDCLPVQNVMGCVDYVRSHNDIDKSLQRLKNVTTTNNRDAESNEERAETEKSAGTSFAASKLRSHALALQCISKDVKIPSNVADLVFQNAPLMNIVGRNGSLESVPHVRAVADRMLQDRLAKRNEESEGLIFN